jgi:hypothetical protein
VPGPLLAVVDHIPSGRRHSGGLPWLSFSTCLHSGQGICRVPGRRDRSHHRKGVNLRPSVSNFESSGVGLARGNCNVRYCLFLLLIPCGKVTSWHFSAQSDLVIATMSRTHVQESQRLAPDWQAWWTSPGCLVTSYQQPHASDAKRANGSIEERGQTPASAWVWFVDDYLNEESDEQHDRGYKSEALPSGWPMLPNPARNPADPTWWCRQWHPVALELWWGILEFLEGQERSPRVKASCFSFIVVISRSPTTGHQDGDVRLCCGRRR